MSFYPVCRCQKCTKLVTCIEVLLISICNISCTSHSLNLSIVKSQHSSILKTIVYFITVILSLIAIFSLIVIFLLFISNKTMRYFSVNIFLSFSSFFLLLLILFKRMFLIHLLTYYHRLQYFISPEFNLIPRSRNAHSVCFQFTDYGKCRWTRQVLAKTTNRDDICKAFSSTFCTDNCAANITQWSFLGIYWLR